MVIQSGGPEIRGLDLNSGEMEFIVEGGGPRYLPSGHLVYGTVDGTMMAVRFDPRKMEMEGTPVAVMDDASFWALADDGKLFYTAGSGGGGSGPTLPLDWVTRSGQATPVDPDWTFQRGIDVNQGWTISPDGSTVAVREFTAEGYDIWVKQLDTGPRSRLTFDGAHERMPVWAPGGRDVTFLSDRGGNLDVWSKPADGTREPELLLDLDASLATVDWSPDGEWLLVRTSTGSLDTSERNILAWRPGVDSVPVPLFQSDYREIKPTVSPDGRWIAYASDETGRYEIYVRPFPDVSAGRWQVSIDGGRSPHWAHSGQELFFQGANAGNDGRRIRTYDIGVRGGGARRPLPGRPVMAVREPQRSLLRRRTRRSAFSDRGHSDGHHRLDGRRAPAPERGSREQLRGGAEAAGGELARQVSLMGPAGLEPATYRL